MVHLSEESLSELLDGGPAPGAAEHLSSCPACQGELESLRQLRTELRELPDLDPPPELWARIEAGLPYGQPSRRRGSWAKRTALQAAAMAAVFVIGLSLGRVFEPGTETQDSQPEAVSLQPSPATLADAMAEVRQLGTQYDLALQNLQRLAAQEGAPLPSLTEQRLVRLNMLVEASRTALAAEPADPLLNAYLFAALDERDAVLREMGAPEGTGSDVLWR
jgi:hypothetical protein